MEKDKIKFKYKFPDDYNPKYANGAYGGIGSQGEIVINFYLERQPIPRVELHQIQHEKSDEENSPPVDIIPEDLSSTLIRYIQTGVVLNLRSARSIHSWLGKHIAILEKMKRPINE